ncbi:MAG: aminotransferase class I/II-fold pyridoxal phosphate-dependent enzyme [Bacteroidia bacterium]|nr:aminotransferase class I/II-fold pyridoxal phosphate-dependent enzyme [Bacteroidia bacterium]
MSASNFAQSVATVRQVVETAKSNNLIHLATEDESLSGRYVQLKGRRLLNVTSCSYLGLELHPGMKAAVKDAVEQYGTQFSSSRAYVSLGLYEELEHQLGEIFGAPVIASASTTLGHLSALPLLVGEEDVVILDHQVHASVSMAAQLLKARGIKLEMLRHNRMDLLEDRIKYLRTRHRHIWYLGDGIYSMYGDKAPLADLERLLDTYEQLHLYLDDAHGTSWYGTHGRGYVREHLPVHPRVIVTASLNKSFAAAGGALILPDTDTRDLIRACGGTMIFCGPIQPPMLGAAVAAARLHLAPEHSRRQQRLHDKIRFFNETAARLEVPLMDTGLSPVRFVHVGTPDVGARLASRLMDLGVYVNLAAYPSVPYKQAGLRMTLHQHLTMDDIQYLLTLISDHLPLVQQELRAVPVPEPLLHA